MIVYNVTVNIDDQIADDWVTYMKSTHIPDVMATGCFSQFLFTRVMTRQEDETGVTFSIQYQSESMDAYQEYRDKHADRLQAEHTALFNGRFAAFRTLLEEV